MVGLVGPIKWSIQAPFIKIPIDNILKITTSIRYFIVLIWNSKSNKSDLNLNHSNRVMDMLNIEFDERKDIKWIKRGILNK